MPALVSLRIHAGVGLAMRSGAHGLPEEGPESISLGPRGMHDSGWVCLGSRSRRTLMLNAKGPWFVLKVPQPAPP